MNPTPPNSKNTVTDSELHAGRDIHIGDNIINERQSDIPPHLTNNIPTNADPEDNQPPQYFRLLKHLLT